MTIRWSPEARDDLDRLADFVTAYDPVLATQIEQELEQAPKKLLAFPRRGPRLSEFDPLEVREHRVRGYLVRYQLINGDIVVLRFFHPRENRF